MFESQQSIEDTIHDNKNGNHMNCNRRKTNKKQREKQIKVTNKTIARTNARYTILPFKWYMANRCITLFSLGIFRQSKNIVI